MSTFYGDQWRWFVGTVTEVGTDLLGLGRVKVRIDGVHGPNIANSDLPYAQCILPTTGGGTSGIGENPALLAEARVCGYFADGDICANAMIIGSLPHYGHPNALQVSNQVTSNQALLTSIRPETRTFVIDHTPTTTVVGDAADNMAITWEFFSTAPGLNYAYKPHQIAGMIGNFMVEGRHFITNEKTGKTRKVEMDPKAKGDFDEETQTYTAIGIAQWRDERKEKLINYSASRGENGLDPLNLITQLKFVDWELRNDSNLRKSFFSTKNVDEATMMFMREYEKPEIVGFKATPQVFSKHVNGRALGRARYMGQFGYTAGYWHTRAGEEDRLKNARGIFNRFTQTLANDGTALSITGPQ